MNHSRDLSSPNHLKTKTFRVSKSKRINIGMRDTPFMIIYSILFYPSQSQRLRSKKNYIIVQIYSLKAENLVIELGHGLRRLVAECAGGLLHS